MRDRGSPPKERVAAYVFDFDSVISDPNRAVALLGGKGHSLALMRTVLGLPVPPGFTISTEACLHYLGIFGLHLTNGILGGIGFYLAIEFIVYLTILPIPLSAMLYSFFLWIVTLVPIHKPITGLNPWNHPLGHGPALASLAGHFAYGLVLSLLFLGFT